MLGGVAIVRLQRNIDRLAADGDRMSGPYYVYILANTRARRPELYIGVTNNLQRRLFLHRHQSTGFVAKYRVDSLVHAEIMSDVRIAIAREKQLKGWLRAKKVALIERTNPTWTDLSPCPDNWQRIDDEA